MSEPSSKVLKLKLLIDKKNEKVLFAEASKDFVDFLFSIISLPLGKIANLLTKSQMVGCIGNLYDSIESLSETYIQSPRNVESLLNPKSIVSPQNPLLLIEGSSDLYTCLNKEVKYCSKCSYRTETTYHAHVADVPNTGCPSCNKAMTCKLQFVDQSDSGGVAYGSGVGFVEGGLATYMVMDNLEVKAMHPISSVSMLTNLFNVKDLTLLEEQVVDVGVEEGLRILQISLQSKDVLTTVFLGNYVEKKQTPKRATK